MVSRMRLLGEAGNTYKQQLDIMSCQQRDLVVRQRQIGAYYCLDSIIAADFKDLGIAI